MSILTQGTQFYILDEADTGNEVIELCGITDPGSFDVSETDIETTNLKSTAREKVSGLKEYSDGSMSFNYIADDAGQQKMLALEASGASFRLLVAFSDGVADPTYAGSYTLPADRTYRDIPVASVTASETASTDDIWRGTYNIKVAGEITKVAKP